MKSILEIAKNVAKTNVNVLLLGESGCGKTTLAKHIHLNSKRAGKPFITINCSTISPNLLESELFGYEGGAFTGANSKGKNRTS
ncbi:sigma 54-interacting transcriptional regulator [Paraclostridium bifermentans]|nr:sigma 54-interacting transcriptional regulator [Paraclostridium bifermentans]